MQQPNVRVGQTLTYNDGREGHRNVRAVIVALTADGFIAQFEDRADVTPIAWHEMEWLRFITFSEHSA